MNSEETRLIEENPRFVQVDKNVEDEVDIRDKFTGPEWVQVNREDFQTGDFLRVWGTEKTVWYLVVCRDQLVTKNVMSLYDVKTYGHDSFQTVNKIKTLDMDQRIAYFANCIAQQKIDSNLKMVYLVKGGKRVKGLPETPAPRDVPLPPGNQGGNGNRSGFVIDSSLDASTLLTTLVDVNEGELSLTWWAGLPWNERAAALSVFDSVTGKHQAIFKGDDSTAKYHEWMRLLRIAREAPSETGKILKSQKNEFEEGRHDSFAPVKKKKGEVVKEMIIQPHHTWRDVKAFFPGVETLFQLETHQRAAYVKARTDLKAAFELDGDSDAKWALIKMHEQKCVEGLLQNEGKGDYIKTLRLTDTNGLHSVDGRAFMKALQEVTDKKAKEKKKSDGRPGSDARQQGGGRPGAYGRGGYGRGGGRPIVCFRCNRTGHKADQCRQREVRFQEEGERDAGRGRGRGRGGRGRGND